MIENKRVIAIITARGGSKGLPRKNVLPLGGKPLIAWTIDEANKSSYIDKLVLSTDDAEIAATAREHGCEVPFMRPAELASDEASSVDVITHTMRTIGENYDVIVVLQPTSPLRIAQDIDSCISRCISSGSSCVSVCEMSQSPYLGYKLKGGNTLEPLFSDELKVTRRQDMDDVYVLNGAVYAIETKEFFEYKRFIGSDTVGFVMPSERSVDIDTPMDMEFVRFLVEQDKSE